MTEEQIKYAALYAWVSYDIYTKYRSMLTVHQMVSGKTRARSFVAIHLNTMAISSVAAFEHLCDTDTFDVNEEYDVVQKNGAFLLNIVIVKISLFLLSVGHVMPTSNANSCLSRWKEFN